MLEFEGNGFQYEIGEKNEVRAFKKPPFLVIT